MYEDECWYCEPCAARCPTSALIVFGTHTIRRAGEFGQSDREGCGEA